MKAYKGKVEIVCKKEVCIEKKTHIDAKCAECEFAEVGIVDLEDKKIAGYKKKLKIKKYEINKEV